MQIICDNYDKIYFNRIFDHDATVERRMYVTYILNQ